MKKALVAGFAALLATAVCGRGAAAAAGFPEGTQLGDAGHYLDAYPIVYLDNPDGRAFSLAVHAFLWAPETWNADAVRVRLTDPAGRVLVDGDVPLGADHCARLDQPAGAPGVWQLRCNFAPGGEPGSFDRWIRPHVKVYVTSSLPRSVLWTGDPERGQHLAGLRAAFRPHVPRRWWFYVPDGVTAFRVYTQRGRGNSEREDAGITVFSPRGQRTNVLWGQQPLDEGERGGLAGDVRVEPGAGGRFWSVEIRHGDAHNYCNINFAMTGVPPYLARSPEEWFDPRTGRAPAVPVYDDDEFMQFARKKDPRWPNLHHFSPCPSLGDPDGIQVRGAATFALYNPAGRDLLYRVGTYLQRTEAGETGRVVIAASDGRVAADVPAPITHLHGHGSAPRPMPKAATPVCTVAVSGCERWFAFTYPAVPTVLIGRDAGEGWGRFDLEAGTAREWFFFVPPGTRRFEVRAACAHPTDRVALEIDAPDRTAELIYAREGSRAVEVPPGLDGKMWRLRTDVGSASVMDPDAPGAGPSAGPVPRFPHLYLALELKGVPALLAPTWEQWFDPARPSARAWAAE